ncbi:unnamed protein product, partial [marine sediment metagenome]
MKVIRAIFICGAFILLIPAAALADDIVGTITSMEGAVFVDAFGTGEFLRAIPGESLYAKSVVKTEYEGSAAIEMGGVITELAPESTLIIGSLLESREKK